MELVLLPQLFQVGYQPPMDVEDHELRMILCIEVFTEFSEFIGAYSFSTTNKEVEA